MNDSQLDQLLRSCGPCETPASFASEVWNRIAAEPDAPEPLWSRVITLILGPLSQPLGALATCAAFILTGTLIGIGTRPDSLPPEVQYIRTVSPFAHSAEP